MMKNKSECDLHDILSIDKLVHEPARLLLMSILYVIDSADFLFLRNQTEMTQGNLSSHLSKLEKEGYVQIHKEFIGKKPRTLLSLTVEGREAFEQYVKKAKCVIEQLYQSID